MRLRLLRAPCAGLLLAVFIATGCRCKRQEPPAPGGLKPGAPAPAAVVPAASVPPDPYAEGWIGADLADLNAEQAAARGLPDPGGALVVGVPAAARESRAGLLPGDFVYRIDESGVPNAHALAAAVATRDPGSTVRLTVRRGAGRVTLEVPINARPVKVAVEEMTRAGAAWLAGRQQAEGWWPCGSACSGVAKPGIAYTGLAFAALARLSRATRAQDPVIAAALVKAIDFIERNIDSHSGGLLDPREIAAGNPSPLRVFASALALNGLAVLDPAQHGESIRKLAVFLEQRQLSELNGFPPADWHHGGWNRYEDNRGFSLSTDIVILAYVLEALAAAGTPQDRPVWDRARLFLERTQNYDDDPCRPLPGDDGGFRFNPRTSRGVVGDGPPFNSYGTVTADGIRSLIYAGTPAGAPRLDAALAWVRQHYEIDGVPGFPPDFPVPYRNGLKFYYLRSLTEALAAAGREVIVTPDGTSHYWMREVADTLLGLQRPDGSWQNPINIMNEDDPIVATAFALLALGRISARLP